MVIDPIVGVYIPIIRIPIKGGMTIPNIANFDHGTFQKGKACLPTTIFLGDVLLFGGVVVLSNPEQDDRSANPTLPNKATTASVKHTLEQTGPMNYKSINL